MSEVKFPVAKDERDAKLRADQVARLLDSTPDPLYECFIGLAVTSGIDRGPMLKIRPSDYDDLTGALDVQDTKTDARPRTLQLPTTAATFLRRAILLAHPGMDDLVFTWTAGQVRHRWRHVRQAAALPGLRFKDLRSVFADAFVEAGGTLKDLQVVLSHSSGKTSMRYTRAQPIRQQDTMERAAQVLGFVPRHLTIEEGSA